MRRVDREAFIESFGGATDIEYLQLHLPRFLATRERAYRRWRWERADILDVGAHWLHQSVLYAQDGHRVTAADFAVSLDDPAVRDLAQRHNIERVTYTDLSSQQALGGVADDAFDVILFCEIIEHITFNPVAMWSELYRVLRPGGRIIVTTPNFYYAGTLLRTLWRLLSGRGAGIDVEDILRKHTHAPHWKEFSRRELGAYFAMLSPDFLLRRKEYFSYRAPADELSWKRKLVLAPTDMLPVLRQGLYLEVELEAKRAGITVEPGW